MALPVVTSLTDAAMSPVVVLKDTPLVIGPTVSPDDPPGAASMKASMPPMPDAVPLFRVMLAS